MTVESTVSEAELQALRDRYAAEREKRLRPDGVRQYTQTRGDFSYFVDDPYVGRQERDPVTCDVDLCIIGAGFGGILTAIEMQKQGITDVVMVEKGGGFGGTWYWNRYPGLACDMKSYVYLPLLEETGYMPPRNYASGQEIREHAERLVDHFGLRDKGLFQTEAREIRWDDTAARWIVTTSRHDTIRARFVATATGMFSRPKLPGIKGIDLYKGHTFHSSRWDYAYTGGSPDGGMTGLRGKRVALIGTGATAIQLAPHLAEFADHLYLVQRTPSGVDERAEKPTDPDWAASLEPGWQQRMIDNFTALTSGAGADEDLVNDGWTFLYSKMSPLAGGGDLQAMLEAAEYADAEKMNEIRARVDAVVKDPATAEALKPWYRRFCKRPVFHDGFLEMFNRDNVTLLDTDGQGVDEITEDSVVVNGRAYPVDCIIFASGFDIGADSVVKNDFDIIGQDGRRLADVWGEEGLGTLHSAMVHGFPNLFMHQTSQGGLPVNFCHALREMAGHMAYIAGKVKAAGDVAFAQPTAEAQAGWVAHCAAVSGLAKDFLQNCTPGYYNVEGQIDDEAMKGYGYGLGPIMFYNIIRSWREDGLLEGIAVDNAA